MARNTIRPEFQKFAGKIVNIGEFEALVKAEDKGLAASLKAALKYPVTLFRTLQNRYSAWPQLESAQFYLTRETNDAYLAAHPNDDIRPDALPARKEGYFEVSNVLNVLYFHGGPAALTKAFLGAAAQAPDHASELAAGKLVKSGYSIHTNAADNKTALRSIPLTPSVSKYSLFAKYT